MSEFGNKISQLIRRLLDLLADGVYIFIWAGLNWAMHRGFSFFHPSNLVFIFYLISQTTFALATLAVIALHAWKDLTAEPEGGIAGALTKFGHMGKQVSDLIFHSFFLIFWVVSNWLLHRGLKFWDDESIMTFSLHWACQLIFAVSLLFQIIKGMYHEILALHAQLFKIGNVK